MTTKSVVHILLEKISYLGNMLVRSTPGLPGRLDEGQRSKAGVAQANLKTGNYDNDNDEAPAPQNKEQKPNFKVNFMAFFAIMNQQQKQMQIVTGYLQYLQ